MRRIKPVPRMSCHSVASWCHPCAPNLDILTCVKDSHIWAIEHPTYSVLTRPLCALSSLVPPQALAPSKKLRFWSGFAWLVEMAAVVAYVFGAIEAASDCWGVSVSFSNLILAHMKGQAFSDKMALLMV